MGLMLSDYLHRLPPLQPQKGEDDCGVASLMATATLLGAPIHVPARSKNRESYVYLLDQLRPGQSGIANDTLARAAKRLFPRHYRGHGSGTYTGGLALINFISGDIGHYSVVIDLIRANPKRHGKPPAGDDRLILFDTWTGEISSPRVKDVEWRAGDKGYDRWSIQFSRPPLVAAKVGSGCVR